MEKLKCLVPESIKRMVGESSDEDLASTSSTLLHCLLNLPQFQQVTNKSIRLFTSHLINIVSSSINSVIKKNVI